MIHCSLMSFQKKKLISIFHSNYKIAVKDMNCRIIPIINYTKTKEEGMYSGKSSKIEIIVRNHFVETNNVIESKIINKLVKRQCVLIETTRVYTIKL